MSLLQSFFGAQQIETGASAVDAVTYLAALASSPKAIDPLLDSLREITATMQPNQPLSEADLLTLAHVYQQLEQYLLSEDPLRSFNKPTLEAKIRQKFPKPNPAETAFWSHIH